MTSTNLALAPATTDFQFSLPFALLAVSPSLSAFHANRVRVSQSSQSGELKATCCSRCGSYLLANDGSLVLVRSRKSKKSNSCVLGDKERSSKIFQRTCSRCGYEEPIQVHSQAVSQFPRIKKRKLASLDPFTSSAAENLSIEVSPSGSVLPVESPANILDASPARPSPAKPFPSTSTSNDTCASAIPMNEAARLSAPPAFLDRPRARSKKTGLQDMLARKRKRKEEEEKQAKKSANQGGGLMAFLSGL